jgi:hypothetical protein
VATVFVASIVLASAVAVVNVLNSLGALAVLSQADYLMAFTPEQLNALAMLFLRLNNSGLALVELLWAPYLFAFGLLIFKSRRLPLILGILLILASLGYTLNTFTKLLVPNFYPATFTQIAMLLSAVGGLPLMLWLLIKGATEPRPISPAVQPPA